MLRHIGRIHDGNAEPLHVNQYSSGLSSGKRTITNELVPPRTLKSKWQKISELIDKHEDQRLLEQMIILTGIMGRSDLVITGYVCEGCLSISLCAYPRINGVNPIAVHRCDWKWATDNASVLKDKATIINYLEDKLGSHLLITTQILIPTFSCSLKIVPETRIETLRRQKWSCELYRDTRKLKRNDRINVERTIKQCKRDEMDQLQYLESHSPILLGADQLALFEILAGLPNGSVPDYVAARVLSILKRNIGLYKVHYPNGNRYYTIALT